MKTMTYEEALRKATLLLRKAEGGASPEESALFAAKAQEIMDRYNIEKISTDFETSTKPVDEPIQDFTNEPVVTACQKDKIWTNYLGQVVAKYNGCMMYFRERNGGSAVFLVGRPSDVSTARYLIGLLANEVRRLAREHATGYSDKYRRDFKYGAVEAIHGKMLKQWEATKNAVKAEAANPMALMRVTNAIATLEQRVSSVAKWTEENMHLRSGRSNYNPTQTARAHGYAAGQTIQVNRAKGGIAGGGPALKN